MPEHDERTGREGRLDEIIVQILEAREAGGAQRVAEILVLHPEYRKELEEFLENLDRFPPPLPEDHLPVFGDDYEVIEEIGRGGMGIVYKAHQKSLKKIVAIKTIVEGRFATESDVERIYKEARRAARLRHPNIVAVHQVAEHAGQHFFVMEYIEGKNLADLLRDGPVPSLQAAQYVKTVAVAIHYAHQRQILHSDLKPANILLDEQGEPHVTDFGLARRLGEDAKYLPTSAVGGTASYMAPEQVTGEELTTETDVYGLGAVLYALLAGESPFRAKTVEGALRLVREEPPTPPRERNPEVDQDLEVICLKCLSKERNDRYGSADALVEDLARYQSGEETSARTWSHRERILGWCRRNRIVTGLVAALVTMAALTVVMSFLVARARKDAQLTEALQSNAFAARDVSKTSLLQLQDLSDTVEVATTDSHLVDLLASKDRNGLQRYLERICSERPGDFASCFVLDAEGLMLARARSGQSADDDLSGEIFGWRDYFHGAKAHSGLGSRRQIHISSVYRGRSDDLYKFAVSAPILDSNEIFLGVIATSVTTDATMGLVDLDDPRREVALIAPKDVASAELDAGGKPIEYVVLFHPAYRRGVAAVDFPDAGEIVPDLKRVHAAELDTPALLLPAQDDYFDPVQSHLQEYEWRWIAGFAPVGHTGFAVIVQQRFEEALKLDPSVSRNLLVGSVLVSLLALTMVAVALRRRPGQ